MEDVKALIHNMQVLSVNVRQHFYTQQAKLDLDVTYEMVRILAILTHTKYANQQQLADLTFKNKASLTSLIDNMVKRDLVTRTEDTADRRNKIIALTGKGKDYMNKVTPMLEEFFMKMREMITDEEMALLNKTIEKMNALMAK